MRRGATLVPRPHSRRAQGRRRWLEYKRQHIGVGTYALYHGFVDNHLEPALGCIPLGLLSPAHVEAYLTDLDRDGKSPRMRQQLYIALHSACKQALMWRLIPNNPCDAIQRPKAKRHEMVTLNAAQAKALWQAARSDRFFALFVLATITGLRRGELLGLQRDDVDVRRRSLRIRRSVNYVDGKVVIGEVKKERSRRRVEMPALAARIVRDHLARLDREQKKKSPWVFPSATGTAMSPRNLVWQHFKPILKEAKLPNIRFHDLRHTAATLLFELGAHPKIVQEMLGHASVQYTLDIYSHVTPTIQRDAANRMGRLFASENGITMAVRKRKKRTHQTEETIAQ